MICCENIKEITDSVEPVLQWMKRLNLSSARKIKFLGKELGIKYWPTNIFQMFHEPKL